MYKLEDSIRILSKNGFRTKYVGTKMYTHVLGYDVEISDKDKPHFASMQSANAFLLDCILFQLRQRCSTTGADIEETYLMKQIQLLSIFPLTYINNESHIVLQWESCFGDTHYLCYVKHEHKWRLSMVDDNDDGVRRKPSYMVLYFGPISRGTELIFAMSDATVMVGEQVCKARRDRDRRAYLPGGWKNIREVNVVSFTDSRLVVDIKNYLYIDDNTDVVCSHCVYEAVMDDGGIKITEEQVNDEWWGKDYVDNCPPYPTIPTPYNTDMTHLVGEPVFAGSYLWVPHDDIDVLFAKVGNKWVPLSYDPTDPSSVREYIGYVLDENFEREYEMYMQLN